MGCWTAGAQREPKRKLQLHTINAAFPPFLSSLCTYLPASMTSYWEAFLTLITHLTILQGDWASCCHSPWLTYSMNQKHQSKSYPQESCFISKNKQKHSNSGHFPCLLRINVRAVLSFPYLPSNQISNVTSFMPAGLLPHVSEMSLEFPIHSSSHHCSTQM